MQPVATTFQRARLWGQPQQLATLWARQSPESSRAQTTVAMMDTSAGNPERALRRLAPLWRQRPNDLQIAFNYVNAACAFQGLSVADSLAVASTLEHANAGVQLIHRWLGNSIDTAAAGRCKGLTLADAELWLAAVLRNPKLAGESTRGQDIEPLQALLAIRKQQPDMALQHFNSALLAFTTPDVAARQATLLARNGYYEQALAHLDAYEQLKEQVQRPGRGMPQLHAKVLQWQAYWPNEMALLRAKLKSEIAARGSLGTE